jgi:hypothetical protein
VRAGVRRYVWVLQYLYSSTVVGGPGVTSRSSSKRVTAHLARNTAQEAPSPVRMESAEGAVL